MLPVDTYRRLDATALAALLARRELHPAELLASALAAVEALDPGIGAVVALHADEAAAQVAAGLPSGPLAGLPFLLKDLGVAQRGTITTHGLPARYDRPAAADCPTVARCRAAGLVLLGKTHTAPLGMGVETVSRRFGATRNPWDRTRTAGGSSGGAAAAVAAGMVPVAQGSDGGGSLRIPAACCGVVTLLPTAGSAPLRPRGGPAPRPVRHVITRTVRDLALFTGVLSGSPMPTLAPRSDPPLRVAVSTPAPLGLPVDPSLVQAVEAAALRAAAAGHRVERADPPLGDADLLAAVGRAQDHAAANALGILGRRLSPAPEVPLADPAAELETMLAARVIRGRSSPRGPPDLPARLRAFRAAMASFFERHDLLLQPVTAALPPPVGALALDAPGDLDLHLLATLAFAPFPWLANAAGLPSLSLPLPTAPGPSGSPSAGLPRGLLVTGRWGAEATLLAFAAWWEAEAPWTSRT